jgi:Drexlerviridae HNH endonuclease
MQVDHINRVRGDDRIENLRLATNRQNCQNLSAQSKHGVGVYKLKNRNWFQVKANLSGSLKYIGCYRTEAEAQAAYRKAVENE